MLPELTKKKKYEGKWDTFQNTPRIIIFRKIRAARKGCSFHLEMHLGDKSPPVCRRTDSGEVATHCFFTSVS